MNSITICNLTRNKLTSSEVGLFDRFYQKQNVNISDMQPRTSRPILDPLPISSVM